MAVVYKMHFVGSVKFYIGSAFVFEKRAANHKSNFIKGNHENDRLQKMFNKYKDYYYEIIEECPKEVVLVKEQEAIDLLQPDLNINKIATRPPVHYGKDHWTNNSHRGLEYRKEMSIKFSGELNPAKRPEVRKKIGDSRRGRKFPKLSAAKKGIPGTMLGKYHTEKALNKMRTPRPRVECCNCGLLISKMHLGRHLNSKCQKFK